jgi:hypothetical protein
MNNRKPLTLSVKLDFLGKGKYVLRSFADTPDSNERPTALAEAARTVTAKDTLEIPLQTAGGFVLTLKPAR